MERFTRSDKTDLSGLNPDQVRDYLRPKYDSDSDLFSWEGIKHGIGIPLLVLVTLASIALTAWLLFDIL